MYPVYVIVRPTTLYIPAEGVTDGRVDTLQ